MCKPQRVLKCHYICEACDHEWSDPLLVAGTSWCPCCDGATEPYSVEEMFDGCIYDEEEESLDA